MPKLCVAALALGLCLGFSAAQQAPADKWTITRLAVPKDLAGISFESERFPGFEGPSVAHDGGMVAVVKTGSQWRVIRLKKGRMEALPLPGGKTAHDSPIELWDTPHGPFAVVGVGGLDSIVCPLNGNELKALKNADGEDFTGYLSGISDPAGLPMLSTYREIKLMSYVHVLHVIRDGVVKPVIDADGKPVEAHKWTGVCGQRQVFSIVTEPDGNFEEHAQYFRLRGEVCEPMELGQPPVPEGVEDTRAYVDRYFYGGEQVIFGWNEDGDEFRVWLERDGKPEWLKHGASTLNRKFNLVGWFDQVTYMAGIDRDGEESRAVAYRLTGDKVEPLRWPAGADPEAAWFVQADRQILLVQQAEGGDRYWRLADDEFRPILTGDGKPLLLPESAKLHDNGFHVETERGGARIYILEDDKALPVTDANGKPVELPISSRMVRVDGQPLLMWNGPGPDETYTTHVARVQSNGEGEVVLRAGGKTLPAGMALFLAADDGVYVEVLAAKQGDPSTFWYVRGN